MNSIPGSNDPFGFDGIDNLFRAMNQQAQRRNANNLTHNQAAQLITVVITVVMVAAYFHNLVLTLLI